MINVHFVDFVLVFFFGGIAYQGKDIVFKFIIEYSILTNVGPQFSRSFFK
jgi:hypothetical protein